MFTMYWTDTDIGSTHPHQVWCSVQTLENNLQFWTSLPKPSQPTGPVCSERGLPKWSVATCGEMRRKHLEADFIFRFSYQSADGDP